MTPRERPSETEQAETEQAPEPQPEHEEPRLDDPGLGDLSGRDAVAIGIRAARQALDDNVTTWAGALAYSGFLALPAMLLLSLGVFALTAGDRAVDTVLDKLGNVVPDQAVSLLDDSLRRIVDNQGGGLAMIAVGAVLALWSTTSAMSTLMTGLNRVYDRDETRSFLKVRLTALVLFALGVVALGLVVGLLILGPHVSGWVGDAVGLESLVAWVWWAAQWPILLGGLLFLFAAILYLGPNIEPRRFAFVTPGSIVAVVIWLAASGLFAVYVSMFGSYNKTWGSLSAVIVLLTWLWLSALAMLLGAEVNAEVERSRELRQGKQADAHLEASTRE